MIRVAFGPATDTPSWEWVGIDTAKALAPYFATTIFESFSVAPAADIVVTIKHSPPADFIAKVHARGGKLVYLPIDRYESEEEINNDHDFLCSCDQVLLHSAALLPFIEPHCRKVRLVEHHCRYALNETVPFRTDGYLLWIGAAQHLPHVISWLKGHPTHTEIRLLTNLHDIRGRAAAHFRAHRMGMSLCVKGGKVNGFPVFAWSEEAQREMMSECCAAFDIKGNDFNQSTKPATKAQQFVASGIPFGCNPGSSVAVWFHSQGFDVACANDHDRLRSRSYWTETQEFGRVLRKSLSMDAVLQSYRQAFTSLLSGTSSIETE
jgi:hypothetical protein